MTLRATKTNNYEIQAGKEKEDKWKLKNGMGNVFITKKWCGELVYYKKMEKNFDKELFQKHIREKFLQMRSRQKAWTT